MGGPLPKPPWVEPWGEKTSVGATCLALRHRHRSHPLPPFLVGPHQAAGSPEAFPKIWGGLGGAGTGDPIFWPAAAFLEAPILLSKV